MNENKIYIKRGLLLAATLFILHKIVCLNYMYPLAPICTISFGLVIFLFLTNNTIKNVLICGFTGLFTLIASELAVSVTGISKFFFGEITCWFDVYAYGIVGSFISVIVVFITIFSGVKIHGIPTNSEGEIPLENNKKLRLFIYTVVSAVSFPYLALPENSGIGVVIFSALQLICLWFCVPDRKRLWWFIPAAILSANYFISGNDIWRLSNLFVSILIYCLMFTRVNILDTSISFIWSIIQKAVEPFRSFTLPVKWAAALSSRKSDVVRRILSAIVLAFVMVSILTAILSSADMIFEIGVNEFLNAVKEMVNINAVIKVIIGIAAGLYLFGIVYSSYDNTPKIRREIPTKDGDLIILSVILISVLAVYTVFVAIQFKYLFAGAELPNELTYTEYAHKGFFELLFISAINIVIILICTALTKTKKGVKQIFVKLLCEYMCAVTVVILCSSFYRMWLYNADDGLTRLRFLVFGFLIFELIGLVFTFIYILKPRFNIIAVYMGIALVYYLSLNLVPIDRFVAKNQVDMYLSGNRQDIAYALTLSSDAAPEIERLLSTEVEAEALKYFSSFKSDIPPRWQRWNLSLSNCTDIAAKH